MLIRNGDRHELHCLYFGGLLRLLWPRFSPIMTSIRPLMAVALTLLCGLAARSADVAVDPAETVAHRAFGGLQPRLSPDGKQIALSFQGSIAVMPSEGGVLTVLTRAEGWDVEPAWSADGAR